MRLPASTAFTLKRILPRSDRNEEGTRLRLALESPIGDSWRERIERWDGSETTVVAPATGPGVRFFAMPGSPAIARLRAAAEAGGATWESAVSGTVGWAEGQSPPLGQDAAMRSDDNEFGPIEMRRNLRSRLHRNRMCPKGRF